MNNEVLDGIGVVADIGIVDEAACIVGRMQRQRQRWRRSRPRRKARKHIAMDHSLACSSFLALFPIVTIDMVALIVVIIIIIIIVAAAATATTTTTAVAGDQTTQPPQAVAEAFSPPHSFRPFRGGDGGGNGRLHFRRTPHDLCHHRLVHRRRGLTGFEEYCNDVVAAKGADARLWPRERRRTLRLGLWEGRIGGEEEETEEEEEEEGDKNENEYDGVSSSSFNTLSMGGRDDIQARKYTNELKPTSEKETERSSLLSPFYSSVDVVLFGIGDLRTSDHPGLCYALARSSLASSSSSPSSSGGGSGSGGGGRRGRSIVMPLVVLDSVDTLPNLPQARTQTLNAASLLSSSLLSLEKRLSTIGGNAKGDAAVGFRLNVKFAEKGVGLKEALVEALMEAKDEVQKLAEVDAAASKDGLNNSDDDNDGASSEYVRRLPEMTIHVCDLGDADNSIGYGPYAHLTRHSEGDKDKALLVLPDGTRVAIRPWTCHLRDGPMSDLDRRNGHDFPDSYPEYQERYNINTRGLADGAGKLNAPLAVPSIRRGDDHDHDDDVVVSALLVPSLSLDEQDGKFEMRVLRKLCDALRIDPTDPAVESRLMAERNTGLYGTHWAGLDYNGDNNDDTIMSEADVLSGIDAYASHGENDDRFLQSDWWNKRRLARNGLSLEHAALEWMTGELLLLDAGRTEEGRGRNQLGFGEVKSGNLIQGELITRFLAAPLLYGVVSTRQVYHAAAAASAKDNSPLSLLLPPPLGKESVLKTFAEGREWHKLFAAKNIRSGQNMASSLTPPTLPKGDVTSASVVPGSNGDVSYGYWRWQGFLCRYGAATLFDGGDDDDNDDDGGNAKDDGDAAASVPPSVSGEDAASDGVILIHGFGASASQWSKLIKELSQRRWSTSSSSSSFSTTSSARVAFVAAAPDLIGFGQSEKPPITYTQYLWESYVSSFVREVCLPPSKLGMRSFVLAGNSIGGYTAMAASADDTVHVATEKDDDNPERGAGTVTASGAPGTGRCNGLILMNSAGQLYKREDIDAMMARGPLATIATVTATDRLPQCTAPPRIVASVLGRILLWYLRPRVLSICSRLYPTNPNAVDGTLTGNILRDSLDPGAINVMISGSKLPVPRTANELLGADFGSSKSIPTLTDASAGAVVSEGTFDGPVLIAQGMLDPLNDARGRADMFGNLREGVDVVRIQGGHCPHDELPEKVAEVVSRWMAART